MEEIVHLIPLGIEVDRAVVPFKGSSGFRANRAYIFSTISYDDTPNWVVKEHKEKVERVKNQLESLGIEIKVINTKLIDLLDVMKKISKIILDEKNRGNNVYINISSAGRLTSVGATLAGMLHDVKVYYVIADGYSKTETDRETHGITICREARIVFLENFKFSIPDDLGQKVLVEIYGKGKMRTVDIINFLSNLGINGFDVDYFSLRRSEKISLMMKLNRKIIDKLENGGYIYKNKLGRENEYELTASGKYIANISGLIPIDLKEIY